MKKSSTAPSLRDLALDAIGVIAAQLQAADPALSKAQAVSKAAQTPGGRSAYAFYKMPGSAFPWPEALGHLAAGEGFLEQASMRDQILQKRQQKLAKVGNNGASGTKTVEAVTGLPAQPAGKKITAPVDPADAIMRSIHEQAAAANPTMTPARATATFLQTSEGQALHRQYNAAQAAKREA